MKKVENPEPNPANDQVISLVDLGYFLKTELNTESFKVNKSNYQLDKDLISEINKNGNSDLKAGIEDYVAQKPNEIHWNTTVLEDFVEKEKGREDRKKTRIFARGGTLCDFFASNVLKIPPITLDFEFNKDKNVLRLFYKTEPNPNATHEPSYRLMITGAHRLIGDKNDPVIYGKDNIYRVMELTTGSYELFYSKEIDVFDGEDPVEIRGVAENGGLKALKIHYRSVAMAEVKKVVAMIFDDKHIQRVSIIDDYSRHDQNPNVLRNKLFKEMDTFFNNYIPIFKLFGKGKITKIGGGMIIQPTIEYSFDKKNVFVVTDYDLDEQLWKFVNKNFNKQRMKKVGGVYFPSNRKYFLCMKNTENLGKEIEKRKGMDAVLGCFVQYEDLQGFEENEQKYINAIPFWKKIIHSVNPDLTLPLDLLEKGSCVFSPFFPSPLFPNGYNVENNSDWRLSSKNNVLFGETAKNVEEILERLSLPLPDFTKQISMKVYSQEDCKEILKRFFRDQITFDEVSEKGKIIFCQIKIIPAKDYRTEVLNVLRNLSPKTKEKPAKTEKTFASADLYLIRKGNVIKSSDPNTSWDTKNDLQLLETFFETRLDSNRKFPDTIALFSSDQEERVRVSDILKDTHENMNNDADVLCFKEKKSQ